MQHRRTHVFRAQLISLHEAKQKTNPIMSLCGGLRLQGKSSGPSRTRDSLSRLSTFSYPGSQLPWRWLIHNKTSAFTFRWRKPRTSRMRDHEAEPSQAIWKQRFGVRIAGAYLWSLAVRGPSLVEIAITPKYFSNMAPRKQHQRRVNTS